MLEISHVSKRFRRGAEVFDALTDINFVVHKGDFIAISGPSGSGKSTLLNVIGGLIRPDTGSVVYGGKSIYEQEGRFLNAYRRREVGFVFQQFHLVPFLTVAENIRLGCAQRSDVEAIGRLLGECSLEKVKDKYPSELSVGEKQRAAFIRAIISAPAILLADEPTGNLDPRNSDILMDLIAEFHRNGGTVLLVSHAPVASGHATRKLQLDLGRILTPAGDPGCPALH